MVNTCGGIGRRMTIAELSRIEEVAGGRILSVRCTSGNDVARVDNSCNVQIVTA